MRIVYVEDNIANVFLVQRVAKMGKHEVIHYIDGNEFLRKYEKAAPDLILMDIQLAGAYSGLDLVKKLRETGDTTPIVAVTAYAMVGDKERCLEAGCDEYMAKPLSVTQMVKLFEIYSAVTEKAKAAILPDPIITEDDPPLSVLPNPQSATTVEFPSLKLTEVEKNDDEAADDVAASDDNPPVSEKPDRLSAADDQSSEPESHPEDRVDNPTASDKPLSSSNAEAPPAKNEEISDSLTASDEQPSSAEADHDNKNYSTVLDKVKSVLDTGRMEATKKSEK